MPSEGKPIISQETIARRTLLDWLGKGCVLALGGSLISACAAQTAASDGRPVTPDGEDHPGSDVRGSNDTGNNTLQDGGPSDGLDTTNSDNVDTSAGDAFLFQPGETTHPVYEGWGERTVDRQDLEQILASWQLQVDGLVESPVTYSFADLINLTRTDILVDFHCVEGWSVYDVPWNGLHLSRIFEQVKPLPQATHVTFHTIGERYNESLPLAVALEPKTILAYGIGGSTLPLKHGFPLRIVIPRLLGYKNAKYVTRIELDDKPVHGFWVSKGYPYDGEVPASRLRDGKY